MLMENTFFKDQYESFRKLTVRSSHSTDTYLGLVSPSYSK